MKIIQQDMRQITSGVLFHQVNCKGIMGGGIARAFAETYPGLEPAYREFCARLKFEDKDLLGKVFVYSVNADLMIANVFGQGDISRSERMTSYDATCEAFERIVKAQARNLHSNWNKHAGRFYFPFKMGCGLGGGEWAIYSSIIQHYFPDAIICQYEPKANSTGRDSHDPEEFKGYVGRE